MLSFIDGLVAHSFLSLVVKFDFKLAKKRAPNWFSLVFRSDHVLFVLSNQSQVYEIDFWWQFSSSLIPRWPPSFFQRLFTMYIVLYGFQWRLHVCSNRVVFDLLSVSSFSLFMFRIVGPSVDFWSICIVRLQHFYVFSLSLSCFHFASPSSLLSLFLCSLNQTWVHWSHIFGRRSLDLSIFVVWGITQQVLSTFWFAFCLTDAFVFSMFSHRKHFWGKIPLDSCWLWSFPLKLQTCWMLCLRSFWVETLLRWKFASRVFFNVRIVAFFWQIKSILILCLLSFNRNSVSVLPFFSRLDSFTHCLTTKLMASFIFYIAIIFTHESFHFSFHF